MGDNIEESFARPKCLETVDHLRLWWTVKRQNQNYSGYYLERIRNTRVRAMFGGS